MACKLVVHPLGAQSARGLFIHSNRRDARRTTARSTLTPVARLAKRVLNLAELFGDNNGAMALDISQDKLAALLGISRQTINRILGDWEARGWIAHRYKRLRTVQPESLHKA